MMSRSYKSGGVQFVACMLLVCSLAAVDLVICGTPEGQLPTLAPAAHDDKASDKTAPTVPSGAFPSATAQPSSLGDLPTTLKPHLDVMAPAASGVAQANLVHHAAAPVASAAATAATGPSQKLGAYFEPICAQVDKLQPKSMFKIQAQIKQFIEKTAGKMSLCFMQHYTIDPNLTPIDKAQLGSICASRTLDASAKGSFKSFVACAEQNWDKNLDAELDEIIKSRHDDENVNEATVISDVVGKVLDDNKTVNKTDIKMIDVGPNAAAHADSQTKKSAAVTTGGMPGDKKIMNDPNTLVVFVDEPSGSTKAPAAGAAAPVGAHGAHSAPAVVQPLPAVTTKPGQPGAPAPVVAGLGALSTLAPLLAVTKAPAVVVTVAPAVSVTTVKPSLGVDGKAAVATSVAPSSNNVKTVVLPPPPKGSSLGEKILSALDKIEMPTAGPKPASETTSQAPAVTTSKSTGAPSTTDKPKTTPSSQGKGSTSAPKSSTTGKPTGAATDKSGSTSTSKPKTGSAASSTPAPGAGPKDAASSKKPEAGGKDKSESKASKDEADAKNAIKALQMQRAQQAHGVSDAQMHQLEHQRQMVIDPIGHTIKHQQYEQSKQMKAAVATAAPGKKPAQ